MGIQEKIVAGENGPDYSTLFDVKFDGLVTDAPPGAVERDMYGRVSIAAARKKLSQLAGNVNREVYGQELVPKNLNPVVAANAARLLSELERRFCANAFLDLKARISQCARWRAFVSHLEREEKDVRIDAEVSKLDGLYAEATIDEDRVAARLKIIEDAKASEAWLADVAGKLLAALEVHEKAGHARSDLQAMYGRAARAHDQLFMLGEDVGPVPVMPKLAETPTLAWRLVAALQKARRDLSNDLPG